MRTESACGLCATNTEHVFDLTGYAKKHRYRLRNLHDGGPVPPAKPVRGSGRPTAYVGAEDRMDAIVGYRGYVATDGNELSVCLFYGSAKGVNRAVSRLEAIGGRIDQLGDTEVGAIVPAQQIDEVLKLIRVSKVANRNPGGNPESLRAPVSERVRDAESSERERVV